LCRSWWIYLNWVLIGCYGQTPCWIACIHALCNGASRQLAISTFSSTNHCRGS
jgi:hypothetical protein